MNNGDPKPKLANQPRIQIVAQEIDGTLMVEGKPSTGKHWVAEVVVYVPEGHYGKALIFKSYDDMMADVPEILQSIKDKFYDKLTKPESTPCQN